MNRIISLAAALALLPFACGEEEPPPRPPLYPEATSPVNVLKNVVIAFNQRDVDLFKDMLSPYVVFYADPGEMGRPRPEGAPYRPPPSYSFTELWHIAENMFNRAYSINLSISTGGIGEPEPEETTYGASNVELSLLVMVDEVNGYLADEGYCHFEFEKYMNEEGQNRWRLTRWWDDTERDGEGPPGVLHVPLWYILSMYETPA